MPDLFTELGDALLRAGISPRQVRRYTRELAEHHLDLIDHLLAQGHSRHQAEQLASARLGSIDALLLPMLADPRFRSVAARWPALYYLALPLLTQVVCALALVFGLIGASATPLRLFLGDLGIGVAVLWLLVPVILSWLLWFAASNRRASLRWPSVSALALCVLATATKIDTTAPVEAIAGELSLGFTQPALLPFLTLTALSLLPFWLRYVFCRLR